MWGSLRERKKTQTGGASLLRAGGGKDGHARLGGQRYDARRRDSRCDESRVGLSVLEALDRSGKSENFNP